MCVVVVITINIKEGENMKEQTVTKLKSMKLKGFMLAYQEQQENTQYHDMIFEDRFALLVEKEYLRRSNNWLERLRRNATMAIYSSIAQIDFSHNRGIAKKSLLEFGNCDWLYKNKNIIITGATGCGKTYIACALADAALKNSLSVKYYKTHELLTDFSIAYEKGEVNRLIAQLAKFNLIILDEWLRDNFQLEQSRFILDLIDSRFRNKSCLFVSQLPIEKWHSRLGEPTIADAILDRIIHDSFKMNLEGDSMRKITSNLVDHLTQKE